MKKLYVIGVLVMTASLAGCTFNNPKISEVSTDIKQELTWESAQIIELTWSAELTGTLSWSVIEEMPVSIDSWIVPLVAGSEKVTSEQSGAVAEITTLIDERKFEPQDESKLTEEDIGLFEEIIQKLQDMGK